MKRLISVLLCTALVFGLLSIFPVKTYAFSGGSGTEDDPYLISTAQDLYELRNNIKAEIAENFLRQQQRQGKMNMEQEDQSKNQPVRALVHSFQRAVQKG